MVLTVPIALGILLAIAPQQEATPPTDEAKAQSPTVEAPPIPSDLPVSVREELAALEARLRIRDARVREAERFLELERVILEENKRQAGIGGVAPRQVQLIEVRVADAETQLEARRAERAEAARMLDELRRRIASPSPEPDIDELRASLQGSLRASETRLQAQEARLRAAELQVESELASQENFLRAIKDGLASPMSLQQAFYRIADARIWRDLMEAERDAARVAWERDRRRYYDFERGDWDEETSHADLEDRVQRLENEVKVLRDEVYYLEEERRRGRYGAHERFGRTGP